MNIRQIIPPVLLLALVGLLAIELPAAIAGRARNYDWFGPVIDARAMLMNRYVESPDEEAMQEAILKATRNRIRPIFMSTTTSVCGMLPLVVFPGAGSELYRGLGSVVLGGLSLSALLTLLIIPPLLRLVAGLAEASAAGRKAGRAGSPAE